MGREVDEGDERAQLEVECVPDHLGGDAEGVEFEFPPSCSASLIEAPFSCRGDPPRRTLTSCSTSIRTSSPRTLGLLPSNQQESCGLRVKR